MRNREQSFLFAVTVRSQKPLTNERLSFLIPYSPLPIFRKTAFFFQKLAMTNHTELLRSRYGEIPFNYEIDWNDSLETLISHRSVRSYLSNPLPPGTLEWLVTAAQSAASSAKIIWRSQVNLLDV